MKYEQDIIDILMQVGDAGLPLQSIVKHIHNARNTLFEPISESSVYQSVRTYIIKTFATMLHGEAPQMAGVHKTRTAKGPVYKIEVFVGMMNGRQKKRYKTFKPPKGVSESRADQLAYQEAARFEDMVRNGDNFDSNQTFADFARYVIDCKKVSGKRNNTLRSYEYMLKRVLPALGAIRVKDLRAAHLTEFYAQLRKPGTRHDKAYAVAKETLVSECRKQGFSQEKLAKKTGLAINTLTEVYRGRHVSTKTAQLIADAL